MDGRIFLKIYALKASALGNCLKYETLKASALGNCVKYETLKASALGNCIKYDTFKASALGNCIKYDKKLTEKLGTPYFTTLLACTRCAETFKRGVGQPELQIAIFNKEFNKKIVTFWMVVFF